MYIIPLWLLGSLCESFGYKNLFLINLLGFCSNCSHKNAINFMSPIINFISGNCMFKGIIKEIIKLY